MVEFKSANLNTGNVLKITEGDTSSVSCDIYYYKILSIEGKFVYRYKNVQNIMVKFYDLHQDPRIIFVNGEYNFVLT